MSRRNFILLIIVLSLIVAGVLGFLYWKSKQAPGDEGTGTNFIAKFNPFKSNVSTPNDDTPPGEEIPVPDTTPTEEEIILKLKKISSIPIAGFTLFKKERFKEVPVPPPAPVPETPAEGTPIVEKKLPTKKVTPPPTEFVTAARYVERATGNIYQTFIDKIEERKFSNTVIPKIYDAYFGNGGQYAIMRHLKGDERTIETILGTLPKEKLGEDLPSNEVKGTLLPDNMKDISLSSDNTKIFYLTNVGQTVVGTIMNIADTKKTQIFESPFTEWLSFWPNKKTITFTTKPSARVSGYMYSLDVDKKTFTRTLGPIAGLTTKMSPDGQEILYSDNTLSLQSYNIATKRSVSLGVKTLPEKCVWSVTNEIVYCAVPGQLENASYPDDWYKGEITFIDQIWKIDIGAGTAKIIADPVYITGEYIDGINLALDAEEQYLFFINKKDSFLWELDLRP